MSNTLDRTQQLARARDCILDRLPLSFGVSIEVLATETGNPAGYLRTALWEMLGEQIIAIQEQTFVRMPVLRHSHLGATPRQLAQMIGPWRNCPSCGAGPSHQQVENFDPVWRDGDVICQLCRTRVRGFDAG